MEPFFTLAQLTLAAGATGVAAACAVVLYRRAAEARTNRKVTS